MHTVKICRYLLIPTLPHIDLSEGQPHGVCGIHACQIVFELSGGKTTNYIYSSIIVFDYWGNKMTEKR